MTTVLRSHVYGEWVEGQGQRQTLFNPTTEEAVGEAGTGGVDFKRVLAYAREHGNPALRNMTFAERGDLLMRISKAINEIREELVELAIRTGGNTRGDAKFDVDGCWQTLAFYAKLGQSLGNRRVLPDGEFEVLLPKNPRYTGHHARVPFTGAAILINAFNFPAWGFGEKAACALLAGMPVISKPATATASVSARVAEAIVEKANLPAGAVQFIAGGVGDLLDHVDAQDVVAFTGSSGTGMTIRSRKAFLERGVRVNVEADSLNAAILGPDVDASSPVFDLFVREVVKDMTQKAGQKCTAIRRVFAPAAIIETVREALIDETKRVKIGDPANADVRMGPVATKQQLDDVRAGIAKLSAGGAKPVHGSGARGTLVGVSGDKGYFVEPTLLQAADARAAAVVHAHEVFGPVQTLLPYSGEAADAVALVRLGGGGLVSSVYSDDQQWIEQAVMGAATHHGRVNIGSSKVADYSFGPGMAVAGLLHGGPGRAGGGEELGGLRGLGLYTQRVALQGFRPIIERLLGLDPATS